MLRKNFDWLRDEFDNFIVATSNYVGFLQCQRITTAANHASENPVRTIDQATTVKLFIRYKFLKKCNKKNIGSTS